MAVRLTGRSLHITGGKTDSNWPRAFACEDHDSLPREPMAVSVNPSPGLKPLPQTASEPGKKVG